MKIKLPRRSDWRVWGVIGDTPTESAKDVLFDARKYLADNYPESDIKDAINILAWREYAIACGK